MVDARPNGGSGLKDNWQNNYRFVAPIKGLVHRFAYTGLVLAAATLMLLGKADVLLVERARIHITDALAPILDVLSQPITSAVELADQVGVLIDLHAENDRLREERARLLHWQTVARRLDAENKAFRDLLNFKPVSDSTFITARVIADSSGAFANSLIVNAGSRDGIDKGQAAVTGEGLVGRIHDVGARSARVLLISDLNSRIPVLIESTNTRAILAGNNSERPYLIYPPSGVAVSLGDRIVSSGHGGAFPPGLPIGVVALISDGGIEVEPYVKRDRIEYVRVANFGLKGILPSPQERVPGAETRQP